ncbi:MAG: ferredoxin [Acidimicrobiales bacterium]|nr:ferredoxin [Acidimicrobiales bacterium]
MRVLVDYDLCESNAVCMGIAPHIFEVRDDDMLYVLKEEVDGDDLALVNQAIERCPKQALSLED